MTWHQTSVVVWCSLGVVLVGAQAAAVVSRGRLPTLGQLVHQVAAVRVGRAALVLGWIWLGWHAFAR